jgi:hypothetical protein
VNQISPLVSGFDVSTKKQVDFKGLRDKNSVAPFLVKVRSSSLFSASSDALQGVLAKRA